MPPSGYVLGAAVHAPLLERMAKPALVPPENFVGNIVFPQNQVSSFLNLAPIVGNEELEVGDDDTIGLKTDFPEVMLSEGEYDFELGYHGRKVILGKLQMIKAAQAQAMANAMGGGGNEQFNLESRVTNLIVRQNMRRAELLKIGQLLRTQNYPGDNVFDPVAIDTMSTTAFLQTLRDAGQLVEAAGKGPANTIIFGDGAWGGALANENFVDLLPDTAYKILTPSAFTPILRLPEKATTDAPAPQILIATATYKTKKKAAPIPMMNLFIWIGRTQPTPQGDGSGFGYNHWHPCIQNGQEFYVNRIVMGNAENVHIGVQMFYRPVVNDGAQGVLIPVTVAA